MQREEPPAPPHAETYSGETSKLADPQGVSRPCCVGLAPFSQGNEAQQVRDPRSLTTCCFPQLQPGCQQGWIFESPGRVCTVAHCSSLKWVPDLSGRC